MPKIEFTDYYSHKLGLNVQVEITGHYGFPVLMFPTSQGSFLQNRDFGLNGSLHHWTENGRLKLFNVQTIDKLSFYDRTIPAWKKIRNHELWIQFLAQEYVPYLMHTHGVSRIAVAGASFGGYHAADFAFRFPGMVSHLFCLSGAFNIRSFMDGYDDALVYMNCPNEFVKNDEAWKYKHMHIVLSTSDWDICREPTREMAGILRSKGINHWYDEKKWIRHDWPLWRMALPEYVAALF
ncbi:esterase [Cruoricaptor ignavus]|uniref:Esterase n=1 Tax=Cruoricaptor ignavus TaxID=1118202 RepID=A0A7M1T271_9FLAO|nr:alpha/beta hydrolase-fold protein [Cruoricaptor ignavus]QOR73915.1 esterase [Cruoricaptor ignavus]